MAIDRRPSPPGGSFGEHDANANIFGVMTAEYTPVGSTTPVLSPPAVLQPRTRQAEHYSGQQGVSIVAKPSANGGSAVRSVMVLLSGSPDLAVRITSAPAQRTP